MAIKFLRIAAAVSSKRLVLCELRALNPTLKGGAVCWQVFRAVRKGVQDAAVKLLTNVETAQLSVFLNVRPSPGLLGHFYPWASMPPVQPWGTGFSGTS